MASCGFVPRTRHKSGTHMSEFLGTGKELLVSDLPTLRDVLRFGILLREQHDEDLRNYLVKEMARDMIPPIVNQWLRANALFKPPVIVSEKTIIDKIIEAWQIASDISLKKAKKAKKEKNVSKLDKLFDILSCKCPMLTCSDQNCGSNCNEKVQPLSNLEFLHTFKRDVSEKTQYQVSNIQLQHQK